MMNFTILHYPFEKRETSKENINNFELLFVCMLYLKIKMISLRLTETRGLTYDKQQW